MNVRSVTRVAAVFIALLFVLLGILQDAARPPKAAAPEQFAQETPAEKDAAAPSPIAPLYPVTKVVDGDTIEVRKNGEIVKVRLIGINTPEVVDPRRPVQCFGREASAEAHRVLDGQSVSLEADPSQDTYDKYGRLLAYAQLTDGTVFNEHMIAAGFAHEYTYNQPYRYQMRFKATEAEARTAKRGLWAPDTCAGDTTQVAR